MYDKILYWYKSGLWSKAKVHDAVVKGKITAKEYKQITGETYKA